MSHHDYDIIQCDDLSWRIVCIYRVHCKGFHTARRIGKTGGLRERVSGFNSVIDSGTIKIPLLLKGKRMYVLVWAKLSGREGGSLLITPLKTHLLLPQEREREREKGQCRELYHTWAAHTHTYEHTNSSVIVKSMTDEEGNPLLALIGSANMSFLLRTLAPCLFYTLFCITEAEEVEGGVKPYRDVTLSLICYYYYYLLNFVFGLRFLVDKETLFISHFRYLMTSTRFGSVSYLLFQIPQVSMPKPGFESGVLRLVN